jgi:hypothetical protein
VIILPEKYNDLDIGKEEKLFVNALKSKLSDTSLMLLNVYPLGKIKNLIIIKENHVCFCQTLDIKDIKVLPILMDSQLQIHEDNIEKLTNKLLKYRIFNNSNKLNIMFKYKYYITHLEKEDILKEEICIENKNFILNNCFFKKDVIGFTKGENIDEVLFSDIETKNYVNLEGDYLSTFIHCISPEYTIPLYNKIPNAKIEKKVSKGVIKKDLQEYQIYNSDFSSKILLLEPEQINIVNNIKSGHQLILACAGSGKSVLLIAKCFKIASIHENEKFLLTCFNKNLNDMYRWRINIAGFRERNVECVTFHKLCKDLLDEIGIYYEIDDFETIFYLAKKSLAEGKIKRRYYGIFIDEVQVFKSEWYEFCYDLLEKKSDEDYFFIICGDKSQTVVNNVRQGKAPWQGNERLPNYRGKSLRIEKNYRNTT